MEIRSVPFEIAWMAMQENLTLLAGDGSLHTVDRVGMRRVAKAPAGSSMLAAKVSTTAGQAAVILDRLHHQLHVAVSSTADVVSFDVDNDPVAVLPMRLNSSARQSLVVLTEGQTAPATLLAATGNVYTVVNTNRAPTAPGSLGAAINAANANPGQDTIVFNIPGNGPFQIQYCSSGADCGGIPNGPPKITQTETSPDGEDRPAYTPCQEVGNFDYMGMFAPALTPSLRSENYRASRHANSDVNHCAIKNLRNEKSA